LKKRGETNDKRKKGMCPMQREGRGQGVKRKRGLADRGGKFSEGKGQAGAVCLVRGEGSLERRGE